MRISVHCDGNVIVTVPARFDNSLLNKFLAEKKKWIIQKIQYFLRISQSPLRSLQVIKRGDYKKYRGEAKRLAEGRLEYFNQSYNYKLNKVCIRNQKTRWGSCSRRRNLNFNYKIIFLPAEFQDYIIVHELCHLGEFNHSRDFWTLVAKTIPDYKKLRNGLKVR